MAKSCPLASDSASAPTILSTDQCDGRVSAQPEVRKVWRARGTPKKNSQSAPNTDVPRLAVRIARARSDSGNVWGVPASGRFCRTSTAGPETCGQNRGAIQDVPGIGLAALKIQTKIRRSQRGLEPVAASLVRLTRGVNEVSKLDRRQMTGHNFGDLASRPPSYFSGPSLEVSASMSCALCQAGLGHHIAILGRRPCWLRLSHGLADPSALVGS